MIVQPLTQSKTSTSSATSNSRIVQPLTTSRPITANTRQVVKPTPTIQPKQPIPQVVKIKPGQKNIFETVQQEAQKLIKVGTGTILSFTQPKIKTPLQKKDNLSPTIKAQTPQQTISPIPQKDIVKPQPITIKPNQKKLTPEQMQQIRPDFGQPQQSPSAMVKNTKQLRADQEKVLQQAKIPKQVAKKAANTLKKASLDFLDSFADSNPTNPFVTFTDKGDGTPVTKAEWKKMDTKQKIGSIANTGLNAFALPGGEAIKMTKGFSKLGAAIGVGTNTIIKYLNDPEHSIKDAIINPENVLFGILGGKLGAKPKLEEVLPAGDHTPQQVIGTVIKNGLDQTPEGKTLVKTAVEAQQRGENVTVKHTHPDVQVLEKNVSDYRSYGGYTAGKSTENAALRDIAKVVDKPEVKAHTQEQITKAIENGEMKINDDGTITLYRGGKPSSKNSLMSATYDKTVAQRFADNAGGVLNEIKVKPEDIQTFIGKAEKEVLLKNEQPKPNVAQQSISDVKATTEAPKVEPKQKITRVSTIGTPKLASGVRQKAIKEKLIYGFDKTFRDLPEYDKVNVKEQGTKATEFLFNNPDDAFEIAMGRKLPPNDILPESIFNAVENYAIETKNVDVLRELATRSELTSQATGMGQRIRMLAERNPNSPATIMRDVSESRKKAIEKKYNTTVKEKISAVEKEVKKKIPKVDKYSWDNFIKSIEC